jgi:hypothetical protein
MQKMKPMSTQTIGGKQYEIVDAQARADAASAQTAAENAQTTAESAQTAAENAQYDQSVYAGVDLSVKFADEIANYSDVWAWIQARIKAANYDGIHVGDYIPFKTTNNVSLNAQVAGIDTYYQYSDTAVGHHIDFICVELWPTNHVFNKVYFNNGVSDDMPYPWFVSDMYHFINSLAGTVPSAAVVGGGDGTEVDYTADGIYYYLPDALKAVIIKKRTLLPKRYSASGILSSDNSWGWGDAGYLWLPTEWEVYGGPVWGNTGYSAGGVMVQYPLFAHNMRAAKKRSGGGRYNWWLLTASSGTTFSGTTSWMYITTYGSISPNVSTATYVTEPVCFRIG